jgi:hypothetical protein
MVREYWQRQAAEHIAQIERREAELAMRQQIAQHAYNPPADMIAPYQAANPGPQQPQPSTPQNGNPGPSQTIEFDDTVERPTNGAAQGTANGNTGMTREQFEAAVQQAMQDFRRANEQLPPSRPTPRPEPSAQPNTPPAADPDAYRPRPSTVTGTFAPRNGYDEYGNRADSPRNRYDENGYLRSSPPASTYTPASRPAPTQTAAPVRQNRVYNAYDGTSRPVGGSNSAWQSYQNVQRWSNNQIAAQQAGRYSPSSSSSSSTAGGSSYSGSSNSASSYSPPSSSSAAGGGQSGARVYFDDTAPRSSPGAVSPRASGTRPQTASLRN